MKLFLYNEQTTTKRLKVASVTISCDRDPDTNRTKITNMVDTITQIHPDVDLVIFGEMIIGRYNPGGMSEYHYHIAEPIPGETTRTLSKLSKEHEIHLSFGMSEINDGTLHNAQVLLNPQGEIQAVHRKWNLKPNEKKANYRPGPVPVTITDIKGVKTGIVICSDVASPRVMWELMKSRLDLIILSLADDSDDNFFMGRFNARMYDAWIITANRYGDESGCFWNGHMIISDPCGELRAIRQDQEQYLIYELGFADKHPWLKRALRNMLVKTPLVYHVLKNWKRVKLYL